jgi:hypothetical protein
MQKFQGRKEKKNGFDDDPSRKTIEKCLRGI